MVLCGARRRGAPPQRSRAVRSEREGRELIIVLDTGGIDGLLPLDVRRTSRFRRLRQDANQILVPTGMMAEGLFTGRVGHDYAVNRLLREVDAVDVDQRLGLAAGALRQEAMRAGPDDPPPSGVDAIVAALADSRASADSVRILTSDLEDLQLLASLGANADRVSVLAV